MDAWVGPEAWTLSRLYLKHVDTNIFIQLYCITSLATMTYFVRHQLCCDDTVETWFNTWEIMHHNSVQKSTVYVISCSWGCHIRLSYLSTSCIWRGGYCHCNPRCHKTVCRTTLSHWVADHKAPQGTTGFSFCIAKYALFNLFTTLSSAMISVGLIWLWLSLFALWKCFDIWGYALQCCRKSVFSCFTVHWNCLKNSMC